MSTVAATRPGVPFGRQLRVELRKTVDTRAGFWLVASVAILAAVATVGVIAFAPVKQLEYSVMLTAIGTPLNLLLPIVAILLVTQEWSHRAGLVTFALSPRRATVIGAKLLAVVLVGLVAAPVAYLIGALGNVVGAAIRGVDPVWDVSLRWWLVLVLAMLLRMLMGFMLGTLFRSSPVAVVGYFVYSFVLQGVFAALEAASAWLKDVLPWLDLGQASGMMFDPSMSGRDWAHLGVSGVIWLVVPMAVGIRSTRRAEIK